MKTSIRADAMRRYLPLALAFGALSLAAVSARAASLDPIMISGLTHKIVGQDSATGAPIEKLTATAVVKFDPVTLTTNSGVALLRHRVRAAALDACESVAPLSPDEGCVIRAVQSARPEVDAAIARARSNPNG